MERYMQWAACIFKWRMTDPGVTNVSDKTAWARILNPTDALSDEWACTFPSRDEHPLHQNKRKTNMMRCLTTYIISLNAQGTVANAKQAQIKGVRSLFIISEKAINFTENEGSGKKMEQMCIKYIFEHKRNG